MSSFQKVLPPSMTVSPGASRPPSSAMAASVAAPAGSMTHTARGAASDFTSSAEVGRRHGALGRQLPPGSGSRS